MRRRFAIFVAVCWALGAGAEPALDARERLLAAADLLAAAERAGDRVAALTDAVRAYEAGLAATRREIRRLTLDERRLDTALADEEADLSTVLALMQNATLQAETQSLLHPGSAADTIRAGTLGRALVPALYQRAAALKDQLQALADTRLLIESAEATLEDGLVGVQTARIALGEALTARRDLPERLATNDAAMQALVNSADTLSGLADSLFGTAQPFEQGQERVWAAPVAGQILTVFGANPDRPGWSVATTPRALITAPAASSVRFSGEFPGFGSVVMLEADGAGLIILAGLSARFVDIGEILPAGAPIGFAGRGQMAAQDKLNVAGGESSLNLNETLYIELRQGGAPVDPATVLTLEQEQG